MGTELEPLEAPSLSGLEGIRHGFFTRHGGVSSGIYASLNCGHGSDDDAQAVAENRKRVCRHLGGKGDACLTVHQIHSATAFVADALIPRDALPKADAVVTRTPGLVVGALAADCAPVLFADPVARVVAAAHAGWRGAVGGILEATVEAMEATGAQRARIVAAVGPCISLAAYEVGPEFEADLLARNPENARFFATVTPGGRAHFDLSAYAFARLEALGLHHCDRIKACTQADDSRFFSYRRSKRLSQPDYGRQISAIVVA